MSGNRLDVQSAASRVFEDPLSTREMPPVKSHGTPPRRGIENDTIVHKMQGSGTTKSVARVRPPLLSVDNGAARPTHSAAFNIHAAAGAATHLSAKAAYKGQSSGSVQQHPSDRFDPVQRLAALLEANRKVPRSPLESPQGKATSHQKKTTRANIAASEEIAARAAPAVGRTRTHPAGSAATPASTRAQSEAYGAAERAPLHKLPKDPVFPSSLSNIVSSAAATAAAPAAAASPLKPASAAALDRVVDHLRVGSMQETSSQQQQQQLLQRSRGVGNCTDSSVQASTKDDELRTTKATKTSVRQQLPSSPQPRAKSCPRPLPVPAPPPPPIYASLAATIHRLPAPPRQQSQQQKPRQGLEKGGSRGEQQRGGRSRITTAKPGGQRDDASSTAGAQPTSGRLPPWMPSSWAPSNTPSPSADGGVAGTEFASTYPPPRHRTATSTATNTAATAEGKPRGVRSSVNSVRSASCGRPISGLPLRRKADAGAPGTPSALFAEADVANERSALEGTIYGSFWSSGGTSSRGARGAEWVRLREGQLAQQQHRQLSVEAPSSSLRSRSLDRDALQPRTPASPPPLGPSSYAVWLHSTSPKRRAPRPLPEACWPPKPMPKYSSSQGGESMGQHNGASNGRSGNDGGSNGDSSSRQEYSSPEKGTVAPKVPVSPASLAAAQIAAAAARLKLFADSTRAERGDDRREGGGLGGEGSSSPRTPERHQNGAGSGSSYHRRSSPPLTPEAAAAMKAALAAARARKFPPSPPPGPECLWLHGHYHSRYFFQIVVG